MFVLRFMTVLYLCKHYIYRLFKFIKLIIYYNMVGIGQIGIFRLPEFGHFITNSFEAHTNQ